MYENVNDYQSALQIVNAETLGGAKVASCVWKHSFHSESCSAEEQFL